MCVRDAGVPEGAARDVGGDECVCPGTKAKERPDLLQEASERIPGAAVKQYLRNTVVLHVEEAMLALVKARPSDPLQFLINHLVSAKAQREA